MEKLPAPNIIWSAGENSGDFLASEVLPSVMQEFPEIEMDGIGGDRMIQSGLTPWFHAKDLSVRGYIEVIKHLPRILKIRSQMLKRVSKMPPNAFIGVDAPDFNLAIEERAKSKGVPVIHMVAPAVWAWRPNRIHQIKRAVDHLLLIFPFEKEIFDTADIPSTYIGHPLARLIPLEPKTEEARRELGLPVQGPVVAVLPGSRKDEIKWCGPQFFGACDVILKSDPSVKFIVPAADEARKAEISKILDTFPKVKEATVLTLGNSHKAMESSDAILVASGTATLEAALYKKPLVVGYAMPALSAMLILSKGQTKWISLPNILAQKTLVPECVQMFCNPDILASHILHALEPSRAEMLRDVFTEMHHSLLRDTPKLASEAIANVLHKS